MKIAGIVLLVIGLVGSIFFGIRAFSNSETFQVLGMEFAASNASWTPFIVSVVVLVLGIILSTLSRRV